MTVVMVIIMINTDGKMIIIFIITTEKLNAEWVTTAANRSTCQNNHYRHYGQVENNVESLRLTKENMHETQPWR